jgi:ElaB/YqjD/DUF883 family membrane-anchored ribosome-binding protein
MTATAIVSTGFDFAALLALVIAAGQAYASTRLIRPQRQKVIAETRDVAGQEADRIIGRYRELLEQADEKLESCHARIDDLAEREHECERRAEHLARRVSDLERHRLGGT